MAGLHRIHSGKAKFVVLRRDGSMPEWPNFVLGARDPAAPTALRAYAEQALECDMDQQYVDDLYDLANEFEAYRRKFGNGDPDAPLHRTEDPQIAEIEARRHL